MYQKKEKIFLQKTSPHLSQLMLRWLRNYFRQNNLQILKLATYIQRLKITILGANWQLFRLERIAKCSYFVMSTQNIEFYWFVIKIKKFLLPIWWYNRGLFPLRNKYFGVFILNGLSTVIFTNTQTSTYKFLFFLCDRIAEESEQGQLSFGEVTTSGFTVYWSRWGLSSYALTVGTNTYTVTATSSEVQYYTVSNLDSGSVYDVSLTDGGSASIRTRK